MEDHNGSVDVSGMDGSRRSLVSVLFGAMAAFMAAMLGIPVVRLIFYPLMTKSTETGWTAVGTAAEARNAKAPLRRTLELEVRDAWQETLSKQVVYISESGGDLKVLSAACPHLGCSVSWNEQESQFVCPCHGGRFASDGQYRSGPPPRSLDALDTKIVDGKVMVRYQQFRPNVPYREMTS